MTIAAVLLDFGGTLDAPGVHWSTQFAHAFAAAGATIDRRTLDRAFLRSDEQLAARGPLGALDLAAYVRLQAGLMCETLALPAALGEQAARAFVAAAEANLAEARDLLAARRSRFRFALVSNFPETLRTILARAGLISLFSAIVISEEVGVRKPDPRLFPLALEALGASTAESAMVGDSLKNDVGPAKRAGLTTVWLRGDEPFGGGDPQTADQVVTSLSEALSWLEGVP